MKVRLCGVEGCKLCAHNDAEHQDSGHPDESLASLALGGAVLVAWFALLLIVLPAVLG